MKVDYLIVGQGIAGSVMALTLEQRGKSVAILSKPELSSSSIIAAGVYNPFNFRKTQPVWKASEALAALRKFYAFAEEKLGVQVNSPIAIMTRQFGSTEEQEEWKNYSKQPGARFAKASLDMSFVNVKTPYGFGLLFESGVVDTKLFLESTRNYFNNRGYYLNEKCDHSKFSPIENAVSYDDRIEAKHVIFCEGHLVRTNPFFDSKVVAPTKGELIHVRIPEFGGAINGAVYVIPKEEDGENYVCGATFNPGKDDEETTTEGRDELIRKLKTITNNDITVTAYFAGVRPAGRDRKPVLGRSRNNRNFSIFNGFGSKAVLHSPLLAQMLADHLENGAELPPEINVSRFKIY